MLHKIITAFTYAICVFLRLFNINKYIRKKTDARLVFYHGIGEKSAPCMKYLDDEISEAAFISHLDYLQDNYTFLSLKEVIENIEKGVISTSKPYCSISFDDGLLSVFNTAYPILKERNIPFTVFINTSVIGNNNILWLHLVNYLITNHGLSKTIESINTYSNKIITGEVDSEFALELWCKKNIAHLYEKQVFLKILEMNNLNLGELAKQQNLYLNWEQIMEMSENDVTFYSHTHQHFPLDAFTDIKDIESEIKTSIEIMRKFDDTSDYFVSFPFGMIEDYGQRAIECAFTSGHTYIVEVGDGINQPGSVLKNRILARVSLGDITANQTSLQAAIEIRPVIKHQLRQLKWIPKNGQVAR